MSDRVVNISIENAITSNIDSKSTIYIHNVQMNSVLVILAPEFIKRTCQ